VLALLEPESRAPTFQAWLAHDDHPGTKFGHGMGNGYPMDCAPIGKGGSKWGAYAVQTIHAPHNLSDEIVSDMSDCMQLQGLAARFQVRTPRPIPCLQ
jgi:hypothetical protein